jgi:hypothetical protein
VTVASGCGLLERNIKKKLVSVVDEVLRVLSENFGWTLQRISSTTHLVNCCSNCLSLQKVISRFLAKIKSIRKSKCVSSCKRIIQGSMRDRAARSSFVSVGTESSVGIETSLNGTEGGGGIGVTERGETKENDRDGGVINNGLIIPLQKADFASRQGSS